MNLGKSNKPLTAQTIAPNLKQMKNTPTPEPVWTPSLMGKKGGKTTGAAKVRTLAQCQAAAAASHAKRRKNKREKLRLEKLGGA